MPLNPDGVEVEVSRIDDGGVDPSGIRLPIDRQGQGSIAVVEQLKILKIAFGEVGQGGLMPVAGPGLFRALEGQPARGDGRAQDPQAQAEVR